MTLSQDTNLFACVLQKIDPGATFLESRTLEGGVSALVTVLEGVLSSGERKKMVVRRHGANDLRLNPRIAADEFRLLRTLHAAGLAVPKPVFFDQSAEILGSPYVVVEFVVGETIFDPAQTPVLVPQMAAHLASIHTLDPALLVDLAFLPDMEQAWTERIRTQPATLDDTLSEGRIRDALSAVWPPRRCNPPALLHGDFWPGNLLWRDDGHLAAIVDWEDAALGDPLSDLANARLEILWAFGREAMEEFTRRYRALQQSIDYSGLPAWDLCAAMRPVGKLSNWISDPEKLPTEIMPRRQASRPAARPAQAPTRAAPPPPAPVAAAPHPPAVVQAAPQQPSLFANMASTAAGVAVGSAVGHTIGAGLSGLFGGGSSRAPEQAAPAAAPAAAPQQSQFANACEPDQKAFAACLEKNTNDISACQFYLDMLRQLSGRDSGT
ncbi:hypothetical protein HK405_001554 [Cladochytrium tenue]|nr:hypothetical protein HK405_001554 [Cladochytrium tenue]